MDTDEVWRIVDAERSRLADLLDDLTADEWGRPSLCTDWTIRDVAAHLTLAHMGPGVAAVAMLRARGSFNRMIHDTAVRKARLPVQHFPQDLRAMIGSRKTAPVITVYEPLIDVLCHGQDIARPLGRAYAMPVDAAAAAALRIWDQPFPFWARRRLTGFELVATDTAWRVGAGRHVEGPMSALLLLVSGRSAALAELSGPGAPALAATFTS
ncbi:TIGR03083 family protein [Quadrisphaera granulorum]|uniref:Uncharacterized protein (TIGR03083 family) n=1 Tax=Quadrisphaera granulorum TaxID=317664 RepID=A0A316AB56_9ACTN|nr:maleylpyruvate isomerase family mycothiol-dependent enzyme [Quadrisphaera granulorum]PWJ54943.1 uncharacterized protein (TIGR03083 family) [Quadrisphaera granulorum]SZE95889.1 TIGR03083 family protein [Quadrisphaera granulorum]